MMRRQYDEESSGSLDRTPSEAKSHVIVWQEVTVTSMTNANTLGVEYSDHCQEAMGTE